MALELETRSVRFLLTYVCGPSSIETRHATLLHWLSHERSNPGSTEASLALAHLLYILCVYNPSDSSLATTKVLEDLAFALSRLRAARKPDGYSVAEREGLIWVLTVAGSKRILNRRALKKRLQPFPFLIHMLQTFLETRDRQYWSARIRKFFGTQEAWKIGRSREPKQCRC
jgi:hypothetical protein